MKFRRLGKRMCEISKIPPGLQLFTLRNEMKEDFFGTLKKVAQMGYKTVEFAGYYDIPAVEIKKALDDFGLLGVSSHVSIEALEKELHKQIDYSLTIGGQYIVVPYVPKETFADESKFRSLISTLRKAGKEVISNGLKFAYHAHTQEFEKKGGKIILDLLLEQVDFMQVELDLYWAKKAGLDPIKALLAYRGRVPLIHVKDMDEHGNFTEVGRGIIDWPSIFAVIRDIGVKYYFVEQDISQHPLKSVKMSLDYLKSIGVYDIKD